MQRKEYVTTEDPIKMPTVIKEVLSETWYDWQRSCDSERNKLGSNGDNLQILIVQLQETLIAEIFV